MASSSKLFSFGLGAALVITVLGLRWAVIDHYGMDLPENDQWDAEGIHSLLAWYQHRPLLPELFTPHNEHYVVLTKLLNLGVTVVNGQWDQRLEGLVNAFLPAVLAVALWRWARGFARPSLVAPLAITLALAWGLPLSWQNVIAGFHSQQFFMLGLAFATIVWLPFARPGGLRWWLGAIAGATGLLSMASGFFAAAIVLVLLGLRLVLRETTWRAAWPSAVIALAICTAGWLMRHEVYYHAGLKAQNIHDFVQTIVLSLQWPAPFSRWFGVLLWLPSAWLAWSLWRSRRIPDGSRVYAWVLLGLGGWVGLQLLATAYARGAGGPPPAVRYVDTLVFGGLVNLLALTWLGRARDPRGRELSANSTPSLSTVNPVLVAIVALPWVSVFVWGGYRETRRSFQEDFPQARDYEKKAIARTRAFVATHEIAYLNDPEIPYPSADAFVERIDRPELSRLLPVSVRPGLTLEAAAGSTGFERADNARPVPPGTRGPFGVIPGMTSESSRALPPLHRPTWSSFNARHDSTAKTWSSRPITTPVGRGCLVFALSGDPRCALELHDAKSEQLLDTLRPTATDRWTTLTTPAPAHSFILRARIESTGTWLGFSEPVFMPTLSYLAWRITAGGSAVASLGLLAMFGCAVGMWSDARRNRRSREATAGTDDAARLDEEFYRSKSWGAVPIRSAQDLPSLKLRYLMELLDRRANRAARLLEVGSGSGRILASIRQRDSELRLTGIDLSAEQTGLARSIHRDIEFVCGNGETLPFADDSFEYVIFFDYLEHIERPRQSLAEIRRVLKPGGHLHLVCPAERQSIYGLSSKLFRRHFKESTAGHIQQFSRRELDALVKEAGLTVVERRYSYHLLGSLMDYTLFALMLHPRVYATYWSGNPYYAKSESQARSGAFQRLLRLGNAIAYHESKLLGKIAFGATAVHLTAQKPNDAPTTTA